MKKFLASILALAMSLSCASFSVMAAEELPGCTVNAIEGEDLKIPGNYSDGTIALDYGLIFTALDKIEDVENTPKANWLCDFEITFSEDTTAILSGNYGDFGWISLYSPDEDELYGFTNKGYEFSAGQKVKVMGELFRPIFEDIIKTNPNLTYAEIVNDVKKFACGVKLTGNVDTDVTLELRLYEAVKSDKPDPENGNQYTYTLTGNEYTIDSYTFSYSGIATKLAEQDLTVDEKVEIINENADKFNTETVAQQIVALPLEAKEKISMEAINNVEKEEVELVDGSTANVTVETIANTNTDIKIEVKETAAGDIEEDFISIDGEVYSIDAYQFDTSTGEIIDDDVEEISSPVIVKIPVANSANVKSILHSHNGKIESIADFERGNGYVAFKMVKFSQIALVFAATPVSNGATLKFVPLNDDTEDGTQEFNLVLEGTSLDSVKNFAAIEFGLITTDEQTGYDIKVNNPLETSITYSTNPTDSSRRYYRINLKKWNKDTSWTANITDSALVLGTLTVTSRGVAANGEIAFVGDIKANKISGDSDNSAMIIDTVAGDSAIYDIAIPTRTLSVEVRTVAKNDDQYIKVNNNNYNYQDMRVIISGEDLENDKVVYLGQGTVVTFENDTYKFDLPLTYNNNYAVKIEGAGYRTAECYINLDCNKTVKFWTNADDNKLPMEICANDGEKQMAVSSFLAGDVVEDGIVNIYDLSAVVSYFNEKVEDRTVANPLAQYDLNRDGIVNTRDITMVLSSWGY